MTQAGPCARRRRYVDSLSTRRLLAKTISVRMERLLIEVARAVPHSELTTGLAGGSIEGIHVDLPLIAAPEGEPVILERGHSSQARSDDNGCAYS